MQAGRELDALVAEKVMGWPRRRVKVCRGSGQHMECWEVEALVAGERIHALNPLDQPGNHAGCPHYSTDIAAAWEVRDAVNKLIFSKRLAFKAALQDVITERMKIERAKIHPDEIVLLVEPLDLCVAALKAVGA